MLNSDGGPAVEAFLEYKEGVMELRAQAHDMLLPCTYKDELESLFKKLKSFSKDPRIKNYLGPAGLFGNMDKKRVEKGNGEIVHVDVWAAGLQLPSIADVDLGETSSEEEEEEGGVAPGFNVPDDEEEEFGEC